MDLTLSSRVQARAQSIVVSSWTGSHSRTVVSLLPPMSRKRSLQDEIDALQHACVLVVWTGRRCKSRALRPGSDIGTEWSSVVAGRSSSTVNDSHRIIKLDADCTLLWYLQVTIESLVLASTVRYIPRHLRKYLSCSPILAQNSIQNQFLANRFVLFVWIRHGSDFKNYVSEKSICRAVLTRRRSRNTARRASQMVFTRRPGK